MDRTRALLTHQTCAGIVITSAQIQDCNIRSALWLLFIAFARSEWLQLTLLLGLSRQSLILCHLLQDIREGKGETPTEGSTCAIDWDGYTIGYYVSSHL